VPEALRVQAYFDAEVDAGKRRPDIERHLEGCDECPPGTSRTSERARTALRRDLNGIFGLRPRLRCAHCEALDEETPARTAAATPSGRARWGAPPFLDGRRERRGCKCHFAAA